MSSVPLQFVVVDAYPGTFKLNVFAAVEVPVIDPNNSIPPIFLLVDVINVFDTVPDPSAYNKN